MLFSAVLIDVAQTGYYVDVINVANSGDPFFRKLIRARLQIWLAYFYSFQELPDRIYVYVS